MDVSNSKVFRMNGGVGETSYANNSLLQSTVLSKSDHLKKEAIRRMYQSFVSFPASQCLCIADLGCSSGPNALLAVQQLIAAVDDIRQESGHHQSLDIQLLLNDLPDNDFNTVFRSLPNFHRQNESNIGRCFVNGVPGSFYGPLFPRESLHFVHSSYSLHWLSRAPQNLGTSNKGEIWLSRSSPESVLEAYSEQFRADFSTFLKYRSDEMVTGGCMVFTLMGRQNDDNNSTATDDASPYTCWNLLSLVLRQMVSEGLIEEEKLDSFNLPCYMPTEREIRSEVEKQLGSSSFSINCVDATEVGWEYSGIMGIIRAVAEPMLAAVFGGDHMDGVFTRYARILSDTMSGKSCIHLNITVSLTKL